MEWIQHVLEWLVPAGGLGSVAVWLTSRTLRHLRTAKEVHDTYKTVYEDVSTEIRELRGEVAKLRHQGLCG
jgi:hypothetical protein